MWLPSGTSLWCTIEIELLFDDENELVTEIETNLLFDEKLQ